jgi:hypothetical protein
MAQRAPLGPGRRCLLSDAHGRPLPSNRTSRQRLQELQARNVRPSALVNHHAPVKSPGRKLQIHKPGSGSHLPDLGTDEALLQRGAEAIERIGTHRVEAAVAVVADRERGRRQVHAFSQPSQTSQRPIDAEGNQFGDELLGAGRQLSDHETSGIGKTPEPAEPARVVIEGVIEVKEQLRAGLQRLGAGSYSGSRAGHVVEHAEAVAIILGVGREAADGH